MSDFIFKVPELPEDTLLKRRTRDVARERNNDRSRAFFCGESRNTAQMSRCFGLKSIKEKNEEDLAKPSTSKILNDNKVSVFQSSFINAENRNSYNMNISARSNCPLDTRKRPNGFNNSFNNSNQQSVFTNRLSRFNLNLSSIHVNNPYQGVNPNFRNSSVKFNNLYGKNQCDYPDQSKYFNVNNIEPCSSMGVGKSVFSSGLLPEKSGVKNMTLNKSMNKVSAKFSSYDTLNGTGVIPKDSVCPLNSGQSVLENQTIMKSVLQTSVVSMKEQIMNIFENFGQTVLANLPELEGSFLKAAKDVKNIFENSSIFMNQVMGTTEMFSTLNCTSDRIDFRPQNMLQCQYEAQGPNKKPCSILKEILPGEQNEIRKVEFVKTFTVEKKKLRNSSRDIFDLPSNPEDSKEVNLRNWYPVALQEGLAFTGLTDENIEFKTVTVKKRINGRKVLLNNGYICNLIGKGNPEKKFPTDISKKLKNGIDAKWRILKEKIAQFQKECQENLKIPIADNSSSGHKENSSRTSKRKNKTNIMSACKANDDNDSGGELNFVSPKSSKTKSRPESKQKDENQSTKSKNDNGKREKAIENDLKFRSPLKKDEANKKKKTKVGHGKPEEDNNNSRTFYVTRRGRTVKLPKEIWIGDNFKEGESKLDTSKKTEVIPVAKEGNEADSASHLKRKRITTEKASIEAKKYKSEKPKNEDVQTNRRVQKPRERAKKTGDNSEPKSLNSTLNSGRKNSRSKERKKNASPQKTENNDSWVNDFDGGLINISELPSEEPNADMKNMKLLSTETPPLKILRNHLKILRSCTPVTQSPCWLLSQHTESGVKKFEKVRAQTFKQKIPKEKVTKSAAKKPKTDARNKDVDAVLKWIGQREVKSPTKCSKVIKYVIPKRSELEDEDEMDDWEADK